MADALSDADAELDPADGDAFSPPEGPVARAGRWVCQLAIAGLIVMMGIEMVARSVFDWSIQVSNELGGYALVVIAFLSLASGQLQHAYHRVHFVEDRLGATGRALLRLVFDLAALAVTLVLVAAFARFEWITWNSGDVAATSLMTPLWLPRLALPLGALMLAGALGATVLADWRRLQAARGSH